jgi:hypothetical protein
VASKLTLSDIISDISGLDRLLKHKTRIWKLWQETRDSACKAAANLVTQSIRRIFALGVVSLNHIFTQPNILIYLLTYLWSWALLEKLPIVQPLKKFSAFYGTRSVVPRVWSITFWLYEVLFLLMLDHRCVCRVTDRKWDKITAECITSASQPFSRHVVGQCGRGHRQTNIWKLI